jgi:hypothetical protein
MSKYERGTYVKHKLKGEWGFGVVVDRVSQKLHIRFETPPEVKLFNLDTADGFLEIVPDEVVPIDSPLRGRDSTKPQRAAQAGGDSCTACNVRLNRSRRDPSKRWKSCPNCSNRHGSEHVYRLYPDAFGTTPKRESEENPDGIQSYCYTCRQNQEPSFTGPGVRFCSQLGP